MIKYYSEDFFRRIVGALPINEPEIMSPFYIIQPVMEHCC